MTIQSLTDHDECVKLFVVGARRAPNAPQQRAPWLGPVPTGWSSAGGQVQTRATQKGG